MPSCESPMSSLAAPQSDLKAILPVPESWNARSIFAIATADSDCQPNPKSGRRDHQMSGMEKFARMVSLLRTDEVKRNRFLTDPEGVVRDFGLILRSLRRLMTRPRSSERRLLSKPRASPSKIQRSKPLRSLGLSPVINTPRRSSHSVYGCSRSRQICRHWTSPQRVRAQ